MEENLGFRGSHLGQINAGWKAEKKGAKKEEGRELGREEREGRKKEERRKKGASRTWASKPQVITHQETATCRTECEDAVLSS